MADYPTDLTPALADVLGLPNFRLHGLWMALREAGISINSRYEDEQAAALHFLISFALEHGVDWQRKAGERREKLRREHVLRMAVG
jgi:hypothetical protein